jgi:hypothetical protein
MTPAVAMRPASTLIQKMLKAMTVPRHVDIDLPSKDESDYFVRCPTCGGYFDMREADQVYDHLGPLPHPAKDQLQ